MQRVFETIRKVAETDLTVLVRGESGTGKELVAQALHHAQPAPRAGRSSRSTARRSAASWSRASCSATRRAPSPAPTRAAPGRFEAADGGTIFLDEIGDMPLETQAKVLRVLQERIVRARRRHRADRGRRARGRGDAPRPRARGRARRASAKTSTTGCAVVEVELPPLRERREDVPALAQHFLEQVTERLGRPKQRSRRGRARAARAPRAGPATCASCATRSSRRRCSRLRVDNRNTFGQDDGERFRRWLLVADLIVAQRNRELGGGIDVAVHVELQPAHAVGRTPVVAGILLNAHAPGARRIAEKLPEIRDPSILLVLWVVQHDRFLVSVVREHRLAVLDRQQGVNGILAVSRLVAVRADLDSPDLFEAPSGVLVRRRSSAHGDEALLLDGGQRVASVPRRTPASAPRSEPCSDPRPRRPPAQPPRRKKRACAAARSAGSGGCGGARHGAGHQCAAHRARRESSPIAAAFSA